MPPIIGDALSREGKSAIQYAFSSGSDLGRTVGPGAALAAAQSSFLLVELSQAFFVPGY
ncbi:hypothetical protein [Sinorhizobium meliloti]|uniref:hypothetical protein n=1 Tax=Rhizobium meliloti TaxID=382 RepID=UPI00398CC83A